MGVRGCPSPDKTLAFCLKGASTLLERKMRPRRRLWLRLTQAACKRVSSSCTLYEVFGNFAWRNAPPRKRVTQSEKAPDCETESVPAFRLSVDSLLHCNKGNGNGGNSVRKGVSFTCYILSFVGRGTPSHSHSSSSPKSPIGYRFAILALTVKLWLAVLCARLLKGLRLFVGFACCQIMANWASMLKILAKSR